MIKAIFSHPIAKIISVIIAIFVWLHVTTEREYKDVVSLPINIVNVPSQKTVLSVDKKFSFNKTKKEEGGEDSDTYIYSQKAKVEIKGTGKSLMKLHLNIMGGGLKIDVSNFDVGRKRINLQDDYVKYVKLQSKKVTPLEVISPTKINFYFDSLELKKLPIKSNLSVSVADKYKIDEMKFTPDSARILGPTTKVVPLQAIYTVRETLTNIRNKETKTIKLKTPSPSLEIKPAYVDLTLTTIKLIERTVKDVKITIKNPPKDKEVISIPQFVDLTFVGKQSDLDNLVKDSIEAFVDYSLVEKDSVKPSLTYPRELDCIKVTPSKVEIKRP